MYFYGNVFAIAICVVRIRSQHGFKDDSDTDKDEESALANNYSFLALIDVENTNETSEKPPDRCIVFVDGSKRTCTGTIIHDNVVITAAHCFSNNNKNVELTASFVVIGTKKMFDTNYEQYLPIERVITHPNYKGWTADLALVYTFAGMMSDKPGKIIRLANERTSVPDSDVTVFSWGRCGYDVPSETTRDTEPTCSDEDECAEEVSFDEKHMLRTGRTKLQKNRPAKKRRHHRQRKPRKPKTKNTTRAVNGMLSDKEVDLQFRQRQQANESTGISSKDVSLEQKKESSKATSAKSAIYNKKKKNRRALKRMSYYKNNWRRQMGSQKNTLTAEIFGFVNTQACSKLVEKTMPSIYEIENPNEVLCYANEAFYISEEDSGAPAIRRGRLVAVTVGGIDYDEEHMAVGMRIVCFCTWITENLPKTDSDVQCCKKCCDPKKEEERRSRHINKKVKYDYYDDT